MVCVFQLVYNKNTLLLYSYTDKCIKKIISYESNTDLNLSLHIKINVQTHSAVDSSHGSAVERIKISLWIQSRTAEGATFIPESFAHWHSCIPGLPKVRPSPASCGTGTRGSSPEVPGYCYCRNGGGARNTDSRSAVGMLTFTSWGSWG